MKYIICSKAVHKGTSTDDCNNPLTVTEIATELIITRLYCVMLLQENKISTSDTVVTTQERKCLYNNIFENVVSWEEFCNLQVNSDQVIDLLEPEIFNALSGGPVQSRKIPYLPKYQNWERDKNIITDIDFCSLENYDVEQKFVGLVIRTRKAWPEKNLPGKYWKDLIKSLESQNIKVFIFGKETEKYSTAKSTYVSNFQEWCSIVNHPNCHAIVSTITGGVYPAFIVGPAGLKLVIIDNTDQVKVYGYDPSWYNDCINFTKVEKNIIPYIPSPDQVLEIINLQTK